MKISEFMTDGVILDELGRRLARVRLDRNMTQADLAEQAGVSKRTVERLEAGEVAVQLSGLLRILRALHLLDRFDALVPEPLPSPMELLKMRGKQRRRASGVHEPSPASGIWKWGDEQ